MMRTVALFIFGTPLARLFDLNGEVNRVRKKHNRAIIAADVRRFGHVINKDGVLSTHRGFAVREMILSVAARGSARALGRILAKYATYYNQIRTHVSLGEDALCV